MSGNTIMGCLIKNQSVGQDEVFTIDATTDIERLAVGSEVGQ
jgi:hypothetical protein